MHDVHTCARGAGLYLTYVRGAVARAVVELIASSDKKYLPRIRDIRMRPIGA